MSVLQFLSSGGMANIGGDLPESERGMPNGIVKSFSEKVRKYALELQVPASQLKVQQSTFLFVAKDISNWHFIFAESFGANTINYRDLTSYGRIELQSLTYQIRLDVGDPIWAFSCPLNVSLGGLEEQIQRIVKEYVNTVLQSQQKSDKTISNEVVSAPEIASGLEKFRGDFPIGKKTAFIIMKFGETKIHADIAKCIKDTLSTYGITALRADDKQYMDDVFPNIKTYMHGCDFGVDVYERVLADEFNPNVSLEVGYMLGMGKDVLLLKDGTLKALQTDLAGKLYKPFDTSSISTSMPSQIEKWLSDKGLK